MDTGRICKQVLLIALILDGDLWHTMMNMVCMNIGLYILSRIVGVDHFLGWNNGINCK